KPLLLLNGLQIIDDRAHVLRRENELRHVGVTSRKALGQSLGKAFDLVFARERSERRRGHVRAGAGAADGMAARAIRRQQQLAASRGRGGLLCQGGRPSGRDNEGFACTYAFCLGRRLRMAVWVWQQRAKWAAPL